MTRLRLYYEGIFADGVRYPGSALPSRVECRWKHHEAGKTKVVARYRGEHNLPAPSGWEILFCYDPMEVPDGEKIGKLVGEAEGKEYMHSPGLPLTSEAARKGGLKTGHKNGLMYSKEHMAELGRKGGIIHSKEHMTELSHKGGRKGGLISGRKHSKEHMAELGRKGAIFLNASLTPEQRSANARKRGQMNTLSQQKARHEANSSLTPPQVMDIRVKLAKGILQRIIAEEFGVSISTVGAINTGYRYGWCH